MPRKRIAKNSDSPEERQISDGVDPSILKRRWPAADETSVRYNASRNGISLYKHLYDKRVDKDPYEYVSTVRSPPAIRDQSWAIEAALKCTDEFLATASVPRHDIYGKLDIDRIPFAYSGELMGSFTPIDRTLQTPVIIPDAITGEFIRHLQNTLLVEYPLWRVQICGTHVDGEESIMVYPQIVRVGKLQSPPMDLEAALSGWRKQTNAIREKRLGPARRQFQYVKSRLPELLSQIQIGPPVVLGGVFDNWEGDIRYHSLWTLQEESYLCVDPISPKAGRSGPFLHVTAEGKIHFDRIDGVAYRELIQWTYSPAPSRHLTKIVMKDRKNKQRWTLEVRPEDFFTDEQLRARFEDAP